MDYFCTNDDKSNGSNGYKWVLKAIKLFPIDKNKYFFQKKIEINFDAKKFI